MGKFKRFLTKKNPNFFNFNIMEGSLFVTALIVGIITIGKSFIVNRENVTDTTKQKLSGNLDVDSDALEETAMPTEEPYQLKEVYSYEELESDFGLEKFRLGESDYDLLLIHYVKPNWHTLDKIEFFTGQNMSNSRGISSQSQYPFINDLIKWCGLKKEYTLEDIKTSVIKSKEVYDFGWGKTWHDLYGDIPVSEKPVIKNKTQYNG